MRRMVARRSGSIVNVTSRTHIGVAGMATYVATKGAIASATYAWALDLLPHGVRANALAPGASTRAHTLAGDHATFAAPFKKSPDLVAPAVVYLLSRLSEPLTGQVVALMGGRLGLMSHPRLLDRIDEREQWTAREIAETLQRDYADLFQPVGVERIGPAGW